MSRVHRSGVIAGSRSSAKTYADFESHITGLALQGSIAWGATVSGTNGSYITTADNASALGSMVGSSWLDSFRFDQTTVARACQHGMATQPIWQAQRDAGLKILITTGSGSVENYVGKDRNGYNSMSQAGDFGAKRINQIIRWDVALSKAFQSEPRFGGAETEYTW